MPIGIKVHESHDVYEWFSSFLKSLRILEIEDYALINDIESFNTWIKMCRNKEIVSISKVSGDKVEQGGWGRKEKLSDVNQNFWKDKKFCLRTLKLKF